MRGRAFAWANLAYRFLLHLARMPLRLIRRGNDADRFLNAVVPEGTVPLTADERAEFPDFMTCVHCGLCALACPALRDAPADAWAEPWTFVVGPSRSIHQPDLLGAPPPCTRCGACALVCPTGVPIPRLAAMAERLARPRAP
ncbi:MAG TPA: hypothetical protein VF188_13030 [Longimicrobiales bacterium]